MKSKIVNLTLIGALMLGSASTFVSCKDTEADEIASLQAQVTGLHNDLLEQVEALKAQQEQLKTGYTTLYNQLKTDLTEKIDAVSGNVSALQGIVDAIKSCECEELPDFLLEVSTPEELVEALLATGRLNASGPSVSQEDVSPWIEEILSNKYYLTNADLSDYAKTEDVQNAITNALTEYLWVLDAKDQLSGLDERISTAMALAQNAKNAADAAQDTANVALEKAKEALAKCNGLTSEEVGLLITNAINDLEIQNILERIATLEGNTGNTGNGCTCPDWAEDIAGLKTDVATALSNSQLASNTASEALVEAAKLNATTKAYVDSIAADTKDAVLSQLNSELDNYVKKEDLSGYVNEYLANYVTTTDFNTTIAEINNKHAEDINGLQNQINDLISKYDIIVSKYETLVTGVIVQQATNPVVGSLSLPLGVNTTILAAYYGTIGKTLEFPTDRSGYFANENDAAYFYGINSFPGEAQNFKADETAVQSPGDLYVTVNPNDVDYSNLNVSLVNSQDQKAPGYNLSLLEKTDEVLTFGYTRSAENGFYVTHASITDPSEVEKISIDKSELKSSAKTVLSSLKSGSYFSSAKGVANLAASLFSSINNQLPAYAVKATWNDGEKDRSVVSNYNIAATAVPALGFAFGQSVNLNVSLPKIPEFETLMSKLGISINNETFGLTTEEYNNLFGDGIVIDVPLNMVFDVKIDATNVNPVVEIKKENINITVNSSASINSDKVHGEIIDNEDGSQSVKITIDQDAVEANASVADVQITPNVSIPFEDIKIVLEEADAVDASKSQFVLNKTVKVQLTGDQLQQIISREQINQIITNKVNFLYDLGSKFDGLSYRKKFNSLMSKIESLIKTPNKFLQPALFYSNGSSLGQVSASSAAPTVLSGSKQAILYASSYTAEVLAPAYKKYVAVYKKQSDGSWVPYAPANNAAYNTATVIDGEKVKVGFSVEETGVYRIVYQALDFNGQVAGRSYYIQVK